MVLRDRQGILVQADRCVHIGFGYECNALFRCRECKQLFDHAHAHAVKANSFWLCGSCANVFNRRFQ